MTEPTWNLWHGDCRDMLRELPENSIDSVVTDPPYELGFMGRDWDRTGIANDVEMWKLVQRVLKPGGHLLAFSGTRTYHRMVCAIEDAGFEIRDQMAWLYGQGMPKGKNLGVDMASMSGWYTALKPAQEPIVLARKDCSEATILLNAKRWGTGALNVDACRIELVGQTDPRLGGKGSWQTGAMAKSCYGKFEGVEVGSSELGRFPANLLHDGSVEVLSAFPDAPGQQGDLVNHAKDRQSPNGCFGKMAPAVDAIKRDETDKSAARFFKACKLGDLEWLALNLPLLGVNSADALLPLQSVADAIARSDAVISVLRADKRLGVLVTPSTSVTVRESRLIAEAAIGVMTHIESASVFASPLEKRSPSLSPVNVVAHQEPTGTTTITVNLSRLDGSVVSTTFSTMPMNSEAGAKGCGLYSASRVMYCAKATKHDRAGSKHPTVKPQALMRYLCRLVTPPGGTILDPFGGSGATAEAAIREGFSIFLSEKEAQHVADIENRMATMGERE